MLITLHTLLGKTCVHTMCLCLIVSFCALTGQETLIMCYPLQKQKNQIERDMVLFLSLSQGRTLC